MLQPTGLAACSAPAPVDVRERVSDSGWAEQPPVRDMARIHFSRSTCQIVGKYVPVAEMNLHEDDWVYFSHHVLPHAPGNTFIRDLAPGQRICIQPSGLLWKDPTVRMFLHFEYPRGQYWFSSPRWRAKTVWLTLQGPGRVAIQSVFEPPEMVGQVTNCSVATTQYW